MPHAECFRYFSIKRRNSVLSETLLRFERDHGAFFLFLIICLPLLTKHQVINSTIRINLIPKKPLKMALDCRAIKEALSDIEKEDNREEIGKNISIVFFDTETTGLKATSEIIQIAAKCNETIYNKYIMPKREIPKFITELTGLSMVNQTMYNRGGEKLEAMTKKDAVESFIHYLSSFGNRVILVAHNCFNFDAPMLLSLIYEYKMVDEFEKIVAGFSDTLPLFKEALPGRRGEGKDYKLVSLADDFLGDFSGAHCAINDVIMMESLVKHHDIDLDDSRFVNSSKTVREMLEKARTRLRKHYIKKELQAFKNNGDKGDKFVGLDDYMIGRLVTAEIGLCELYYCYRDEGHAGLRHLLSEEIDVGGKISPRVTNSSRIIKNIQLMLDDMFHMEKE